MKNLGEKTLQAHAFVCTNARTDGRDDCAKFGGQEFFAKMKAEIKEKKLNGTLKVTRTGCLGYCNSVGCTVAVYRQDEPSRWYNEVTAEDYGKVWDAMNEPKKS